MVWWDHHPPGGRIPTPNHSLLPNTCSSSLIISFASSIRAVGWRRLLQRHAGAILCAIGRLGRRAAPLHPAAGRLAGAVRTIASGCGGEAGGWGRSYPVRFLWCEEVYQSAFQRAPGAPRVAGEEHILTRGGVRCLKGVPERARYTRTTAVKGGSTTGLVERQHYAVRERKERGRICRCSHPIHTEPGRCRRARHNNPRHAMQCNAADIQDIQKWELRDSRVLLWGGCCSLAMRAGGRAKKRSAGAYSKVYVQSCCFFRALRRV